MGRNRYIWLKGEHIPVTQEVYEAYYRPQWRERKSEKARIFNEVEYCDMTESDTSSAEDIAIAELEKESLQKALNMLSDEERALIEAIYFSKQSERTVAKIFDLPQRTVNWRKQRILAKLKKILNKQ